MGVAAADCTHLLGKGHGRGLVGGIASGCQTARNTADEVLVGADAPDVGSAVTIATAAEELVRTSGLEKQAQWIG